MAVTWARWWRSRSRSGHLLDWPSDEGGAGVSDGLAAPGAEGVLEQWRGGQDLPLTSPMVTESMVNCQYPFLVTGT